MVEGLYIIESKCNVKNEWLVNEGVKLQEAH
jgi:hypothetical protein